MKTKEGRDYIQLSECVASKKNDGILLSVMGESVLISKEDFVKLSKFYNAAQTTVNIRSMK